MQTPTTIPTVSFQAETFAIACAIRRAFRQAGIICGTPHPAGSGYIVRVAAEQEAQAQENAHVKSVYCECKENTP